VKKRLERSVFLLGNAPVTWIIIASLIGFQTVPSLLHELESAQRLFGLNRQALAEGKIHQILSYILIHGSWTHLFLNIAAILLLGSKLENTLERCEIKRLTLYATLGGALMFLLLSPKNQTLVGASPLCFAYLLMLTTLSPESKFLPVFLSGKTLGMAIMLTNLLLAVLNPDLPTGAIAKFGQEIADHIPSLFKTSHACHLGGSMVGWIYGIYMLRPRVSLKTLQQRRKR
jgi:membrane associated rhomboid family serine protease